MLTSEELRELNRRFVEEVFNKKNLGYLDEAFAEDFVEHGDPPPGSSITQDKAGAAEWFKMLHGMSSDMHVEILDIVVSGDQVATRSRARGTDTGGAMPGVPPTNRTYDIEAIDIVRVNDQGQATDHWGITDVAGMMQQLGLVPSGPPPA